VENEPLRVLIVDDSALMRNLISRIVDSAPDLHAAGKAMNGAFALQKLDRLKPDIILLDIEMPEMNGIQFLEERRKRNISIPVVILSSVAKKGAKITMDALALGAADFILKPSGSVSEDIHQVSDQIVEMARHYGRQYRRKSGNQMTPPAPSGPAAPQRPAPVVSPGGSAETRQARPAAVSTAAAAMPSITAGSAAGTTEIVAIGISTGGPNALRKMFAEFDRDLPVPVVVVQHMPAGFTTEFARSLDRICPIEVKEAEEGDLLKPGRVLIAPGNRHIVVEKKPLAAVIHVTDDPPRNGHRPSADVLFSSVAEQYGNHAVAVIMTGMGRDGAAELGTIRAKGGITIGQDEASSVVYGMPKVAFEAGYVSEQLPLHEIAGAICRLSKEKRD